jgi:hypothetical protein
MHNRLSLILASGALLLSGAACLRSFPAPPVVAAEPDTPRRLLVEPGTHLIPSLDGGSSYGMIVMDLDTGETWGFPTQGKFAYPGYQVAKNEPLTVNAVYLGRWNLASMSRRATPRAAPTQ